MLADQNLNYLSDTLEKLKFSFENLNLPEIIFLNKIPDNLHPKHYIALEFAEIYDVDAVFFRYYDDARFCVPQIYFYDNNLKPRNKELIVELHKKVYSSCQVPMICFVDKSEITIYDCRKPVSENKDGTISNDNCIFRKESLNNLEDLSKYFSALHFNYGLFWESDEASKNFLNNQSAYEKLVGALTDIRNEFIKTFAVNKVSKNLADDLLFKCILIKYLEENGKVDNQNFARDFYRRNDIEYDSLSDILKNGKIIKLLDDLENHFKGNVFSIEAQSDRRLLSSLDLTLLAEHLDGKVVENKQITLWNFYSFKDIPIELISNFYESFISTEEHKGTVYTPSFLVNLLVDECLPLSNSEKDKNFNVKLIDVSCGSGIFITSAYKRLIQRWRISKGNDGKPLHKNKVKLKDAKSILSNSIFGVDKNYTAAKLTKFSLQLALCQIVPNNELWNWSEEQIFSDLNANIFHADFFDFLISDKNLHNTFDLVIGNPPFESISNELHSEYLSKLKSLDFEFESKVPDKQLALMFLDCSSVLLKTFGDLCFIMKSTSLLYNKNDISQIFKNNIFEKYFVHQIIDFTLLKNVLFEHALVETAAVFYKKETKEEYTTNHIISRLVKNTKDGLFFEFDYYDFYEVPKNIAIYDKNIWRCNLLGGVRVNYLINSILTENDKKDLKSFLLENLKLSKERYGEGYMRGTKKTSNFITSKRNLIAKNFSYDSHHLVEIDSNQKFTRPRKDNLYKAPLITIKEEISKSNIPIVLHKEDTPFDSRIVGISMPSIQKDEIERLFLILKKNQRIYSLQTLATCAQFYLGSTSVIQKGDIDKWMIPLEGDVINISASEKIVLDDVLDYIYPSWYEGETSTIYNEVTNQSLLFDFSSIYCLSVNSYYSIENKQLYLSKIYDGELFYACEYRFNTEKLDVQIINSNIELETIIKTRMGQNVVYTRVMRIYNNNSITLIKPKKIKYWLKSIALRDADDTFDDIISGG